MSNRTDEFLTLTFKGPRFENHALDLNVLPELIAYQTILHEMAKEVWRAANPGRGRLPKGFEAKLVLRFRELKAGSVTIPIEREILHGDGDLSLSIDDEFTQGARIIKDAIECAQDDRTPPQNLPVSLIPLFETLGKTLVEGEWLEFLTPGSSRPARWDSVTRERVAGWVPRTYSDSVEFRGEVTQADVEGCSFTLKLDSGDKITGKFSAEQESLVTQALQAHQNVRLRVMGRAEFLHSTGKPKRFLDIPTVAIVPPDQDAYDPAERPLWETILDIAATIPDEELARLPVDGAENHDRYLIGRSNS